MSKKIIFMESDGSMGKINLFKLKHKINIDVNFIQFILSILFLCLKVKGIVNWPWPIVLLPVYATTVFELGYILISAGISNIYNKCKKKEEISDSKIVKEEVINNIKSEKKEYTREEKINYLKKEKENLLYKEQENIKTYLEKKK